MTESVLNEKPLVSAQARRHREMHRKVTKFHPEVLSLTGPEYRTAFALPVLLAIHWSVAYTVSDTNLLVVFIAAFFLGQLIIHAAGALVHETAHKLIFRERIPKLLFDLHLEFILGSFGKQLTYQHEHVSSHHAYTGIYDRDYEHEDICGYMARRNYKATHPHRQKIVTLLTLLIHLLPFGLIIADEIFPRFYRYVSGREVNDKQRHINATQPSTLDRNLFIGVSILANILLFTLFGFLGWLYHNWALSIFLGKCGVTNLGQSLSEHEGDNVKNPTKSTYWWGNYILFNTGYHNEHHTFPNVSWNRLPELKRIAPDVFHSESKKSYFRLWWEHVINDFSASRRNELMEKIDLDKRCPVLDR